MGPVAKSLGGGCPVGQSRPNAYVIDGISLTCYVDAIDGTRY